MAFLVGYLFAFAFLINAGAQAQPMQSNISRGAYLTPTTKNSSWVSSSGLFAFGFHKLEGSDGYVVGIVVAGIPQKRLVWSAKGKDGLAFIVSDNATLDLTAEGISLQSTTGETISVATPTGDQSVFSASMRDSGNFVMYNSVQERVWQSFDHPTDTLLPKQRLSAGQQLFSAKSESDPSTGKFRLNMQHDGHLVQYPVNTPDTAPYAYYGTGTFTAGDNVTLNLDADGHLYLLNVNGSNIFNMTQGHGGNNPTNILYLMRIDIDGIFRLYSHSLKQNGSWSVKWSSSNDKCAPLGLCGFNSYCVTMDQEADCKCLPGFKSVNSGNQTSDCGSNSVGDVCNSKNENFSYTMQEVASTRWEINAYMILSLSDKEECKTACLEDCICEAALFEDGSCRKQRLPLRYGRRQLSISSMTLIKVSNISQLPPGPDKIFQHGSKKKDRVEILIVGISFTAFGSILLVSFVFLLWTRNIGAYKRLNHLNAADVEWNEDIAPRAYAYTDLEKMTDNFKEEVGRGASATVYKGVTLGSQKIVAVKKLEKVAEEGEKEFQTELKVIGKTHHRNLVRLLGYCLDGPKKLLVYEYMSNGSLADVLFTPERKPLWEERMGIVRSIARGFLYLHEECDTQIIHCDIKPQNILMDESMCPKISDFGLAKLLQKDQTRTSTGIRGTRGYVAPEWHRKMAVTVKADVYSFGIVLLEIVCCRRNVDSSLPEEEAILDQFAYHCFANDDLKQLVGDEEIDSRQLERVVKVGLWCIQDEPSLRPSMKKVLLMLEGTVEIPIPPDPYAFFSTI